jgi:hypothetical protein
MTGLATGRGGRQIFWRVGTRPGEATASHGPYLNVRPIQIQHYSGWYIPKNGIRPKGEIQCLALTALRAHQSRS